LPRNGQVFRHKRSDKTTPPSASNNWISPWWSVTQNFTSYAQNPLHTFPRNLLQVNKLAASCNGIWETRATRLLPAQTCYRLVTGKLV